MCGYFATKGHSHQPTIDNIHMICMGTVCGSFGTKVTHTTTVDNAIHSSSVCVPIHGGLCMYISMYSVCTCTYMLQHPDRAA